MVKTAYHWKFVTVFISSLLMVLSSFSAAFARMVTQITPTLTISEEYSDNYLKTAANKQEEYITSYGLGFTIGFLEKTSEIYLAYNPVYKDYKNLDARDGLLHNASLDGKFTPTQFTDINTHLAYTSNTDNNAGESWQNIASVFGNTRISKNTTLDYFESYSRNFGEQERTGAFREHDTNRTSAGITHQFGENDRMGAKFLYSFDKSDTADADEHKKYNPSVFATYWLTPLNGLDSNLAYENTDFDTSSNDTRTYSGHLRYLRKFSKHFDGYLKYRHSHSERDTGDHDIYHPSIGFDWQVTKDSGISLGIGAMFHEWENANKDSTEPFLDMDAYKIFNFSRRGSLAITGSSGYSEAGGSSDSIANTTSTSPGTSLPGTEAASLGFRTYYQAGAQLNYQLLKQLSSNVFSSYRLNDYQETGVDRKDNRLTMGGGLSWLPLRWLQFKLTYTYTDFDTDAAAQRGDYTENRAFLSINFIPEQPVRMDFMPSRQSLETEVFQ
nr:outer membrane beta-barrel protein [Desulfobacula sp.]